VTAVAGEIIGWLVVLVNDNTFVRIWSLVYDIPIRFVLDNVWPARIDIGTHRGR
jgi:hypothetical protein